MTEWNTFLEEQEERDTATLFILKRLCDLEARKRFGGDRRTTAL